VEEWTYHRCVIICPNTWTVRPLNENLYNEEKVKTPESINEFIESLVYQHDQAKYEVLEVDNTIRHPYWIIIA